MTDAIFTAQTNSAPLQPMREPLTSSLKTFAGRLAPPLLLAAAAFVLWRELHGLSLGQIRGEIAGWGLPRVGLALVMAGISYGLLATNEQLGLRWAGAKVPLRTGLLGSFIAYAFANSIGLTPLVAGAVRARLYGRHGVDVGKVARTTLYCAISFALGLASLAGLSLLTAPPATFQVLHLHPALARAAGVALLLFPVGYLAACALARGTLRVRGRVFTLPPLSWALAQLVIGVLDNLVTSALVWMLLGAAAPAFPTFASAYSVSTAAGLFSGLPGGVGVFEGAMLALLPNLDRAALTAAFVGYRLFYYIVPLCLAGGLLLAQESGARRVALTLRRTWRLVGPATLAIWSFALGGALVLIAVGRIPTDRLGVLRTVVPLIVVETSHLISLAAGLALMVLSLGLLRRRASARLVALPAAIVAASTAMLRGLDIAPAVLAAMFFIALMTSKRLFTRKGSMRSDELIPWLITGILGVFAGSIALGVWIYDTAPFETRLLTHFGYHADHARFLRSIALLGGLILAGSVWRLARLPHARAVIADPERLDAVRPLVEAAPDTTARLALTGDKALLTSADGEAFLMYGAEGRSLIMLGDPVGDHDHGRKLLWRFRELADSQDARPVIYHASGERITDYLDLGLSAIKLGEEARVPLAGFDLAGGARRNLRQTHARGQRDGLRFEVVPPPIAEDLLERLRPISDIWLQRHGGREKGFSLGRFDPDVLRHDPIALVWRGETIIAFANIWTGGEVEASIDLMRHVEDAPRGTMDFLFVELMLWAKARGYAWFNLGMAPLSGLADHRLASFWHKVGRQIAQRGGAYYGFEGLRAFKSKFDPVWTSRYLAAPPSGLAAALLDATRLIGREPPAPARTRGGDNLTKS
jgi:phosphatidylglycerol lysyltransferase